MAVNEQIVTGRKFRKLLDEATKLWQRISFWTKATDVEFDDGQTAESKMGAIKGITTDLNVTETGYAADATMLTQLYSEILRSVRYNPDSDYIQVYANGVWNNVVLAKLKFNGIFFANGAYNVPYLMGFDYAGIYYQNPDCASMSMGIGFSGDGKILILYIIKQAEHHLSHLAENTYQKIRLI